MSSSQISDVLSRRAKSVARARHSTPLNELVELFASDRSLQLIYVESASRQYVGAVSRKNVLEWISRQGTADWDADESAVDRIRTSLASTSAGDVCRTSEQPPTISQHEDLEAALKLMINADYPVLPVVSEKGLVVGELRVSELLQYSLRGNG